MRREQSVTDEVSSITAAKTPSLLNTVSNHIDQFIIIDRNVDLVTPLCTELTYEGLIDETIGIKHCFVELDANLVNPAQPAAGGAAPKGLNTPQVSTPPAASTNTTAPMKKKKYVLNSSDKLFGQLRDQNFAVVGGMLNKIAKRINENYEVSSTSVSRLRVMGLLIHFLVGETQCQNGCSDPRFCWSIRRASARTSVLENSYDFILGFICCTRYIVCSHFLSCT